MPTNEEIFNLYKETNDIKYRNILLENNYNLIWYVINQISYKKEEPNDLFQKCCIHFLESIDNYDPTKETLFSTYMYHTLRYFLMRDSIKHYTINDSVRDGIIKYEATKFSEKYYSQYQKQPTLEEISKAIKVNKDAIQEVLQLESVSIYSNAFNKDTSTTLEEIVPNNKDDINDFINNEYYKQWVKRMLSKLPKVKQKIIIYSYGIDCVPLTLEEISDKLNITYESAKTYKCDALRFLKKIAENYQYKVDFA